MSLTRAVNTTAFVDSLSGTVLTAQVNVEITQHIFMSQPHHRTAQVWHALSSDHTVLPATHASINKQNKPYLPLVFQLVLIFRPKRYGMLSWPMHHQGG